MTWPTGRRAGIYRLAVSNQFGTDERAIEIGIHGNSSLIPVRSKSSYEFPSGSSNSVTNGPNQQQGNTENNNSSVSDLFYNYFTDLGFFGIDFCLVTTLFFPFQCFRFIQRNWALPFNSYSHKILMWTKFDHDR